MRDVKIFKRVLIGIIILLGLAGGAGYYYLQQNTYEPSSQASQIAQNGKDKKDYLFFETKEKSQKPLVIFYPGALVEPASYSVWAEQLAKSGYSVAIAKMPLDLAILSGNKADKIKEDFSNRNYVIGGHSLGGVMASRYANQHSSDKHLKGIFFLASYPDEKGTLAKTTLPVLSLTASNDKVLNQKAYESAKEYLPEQTEYVSINGGNHGGFGSYGEQKGDGKAKITNEDQQTAITNTLINWLGE